MSVKLPGPRMPLLPTIQFITDPLGMMQQNFARYGDPFLVQIPLGLLAMTRNPEGIKQIFTADAGLFTTTMHTSMEPIMGLKSLLLVPPEQHRRERKMLMPMFHGERMRSYGTVTQDIARGYIEKLTPGAPFEAMPLAQNISLEVIIRNVFGVEESERVRRFMDQIVSMGSSYTPVLALMKASRKGWFSPWKRFAALRDGFNDMLTDQIQRRRASSTQGEDILSLMLHTKYDDGSEMEDEAVRDELRTMLLAGHDTTSITMAWTLYWIHRFPEVKKKLEEELAPLGPRPAPEVLVKLPYLNAVIDETLRLCPVLALAARKLVAPFTLLGHELSAGMGVATSILAAHRNPEIFPEPERFRPERFLERKYSPFEYLPFGGGYRRCIGMAFALYETKVVLGTLLAAYRFSLTSSEEVKLIRRNVALGPSTPIPMRYEGPAHGTVASA